MRLSLSSLWPTRMFPVAEAFLPTTTVEHAIALVPRINPAASAAAVSANLVIATP